MKRLRTILAGFSLSLTLFTLPASAQGEGPRLLLETDPATFAFAGYAAHVRAPLADSGLVAGFGTYGLKLPDFVAELDSRNQGRDFHVEIDKSYGLFLDYHFVGKPEGLFVGIQAALQRHRVTVGGDSAATEVGVLLAMPRVGYLYHPFRDSGFYLLPWVGVGPTLEAYRTNEVASDYPSLPVLAFGTLHVGLSL